MGNPPVMGGTTTIKVPLIPVSVFLLQTSDPNNEVRFNIDGDSFVQPVLNSPIFQNATYSSSDVP